MQRSLFGVITQFRISAMPEEDLSNEQLPGVPVAMRATPVLPDFVTRARIFFN